MIPLLNCQQKRTREKEFLFEEKELLKCIQSGQIAINALPFHIHPFINERQWKLMTNWVDDGLWSQFQPKVGMQHDVNGFPRSAAIGLLDHGVKYLWTGINDHFGGAPFKVPHAFWWKMPDNRKIFVWLGFPYWEGYLFFSEEQWRIHQTQANNSQVWSPRPGDMLRSDEASGRMDPPCGRLRHIPAKNHQAPAFHRTQNVVLAQSTG